MSKEEIIQHNGKLYTITEKHKGYFYVIKAHHLLSGKILVEEIRRVKVVTRSRLEKLIKEGKYETFERVVEE